MHCSICKNDLPKDSYALVEGIYFCLTCFVDRHLGLSITTTTSSQSRKNVETVIGKSYHSSRSLSSSSDLHDQQSTRSSKKRTQTCQVCYDEKSSRHYRPLSNHNCDQLNRSICNQCIYHHIQQTLQDIFTDDIRCPELSCGIKYEYDTIKNILQLNNETKLFERYDSFLVRQQLEQMDEFIWCSNPKCAMGQLHDGGGSSNIVTCFRCHHKTCFLHKIPWHISLTCEEYDSTTDVNFQSSLKWITQNTKQCPKCHFRIEKNDGCDHMTCIHCQYEFCWSCLADFNRIRTDGNHRHDSNCKHYAPYDEI